MMRLTLILLLVFCADFIYSQSPSSPSSESGTTPGQDNLRPTIKKFLQLCTHYRAVQFALMEKFDCGTDCPDVKNPFMYIFIGELFNAGVYCDTILTMEMQRQIVVHANGQMGPSAHAL